MRIICFGDSNTYGWDPREFSTNKYDVQWPELLAAMTGHEVINMGQPGREIYYRDYQYRWFDNYVNQDNHDLLIIMLGSNDLLNSSNANAAVPLERMRIFLSHIINEGISRRILLLSPPAMRLPEKAYNQAVLELAVELRKLADEKGVMYADSTKWDIPLAFDGIHFTEEGHRIFAGKVKELLADADDTEKM